MNRSFLVGAGLLAASAFGFAAVGPLARVGAEHGPPILLSLVRWAMTAVLLTVATFPTLARHRRAVVRDWRRHLVLGLTGAAFNGACIFLAAKTTSAINIGLIGALLPTALIVLASWLILRERQHWMQAPAILLCIAGVALIAIQGRILALAEIQLVAGDLLMVLAAMSWAGYAFALRFLPSELPPMARLGQMAAWGAVCLVPAALLEYWLLDRRSPDLAFFGVALGTAVLPGIVGFTAHAHATRLLGVNRAALVGYIGPLFAVGLSMLFLGESLHLYHLAAGAMILTGVALSNRYAARV
jgi:drug/metabolite transporter (DMT)-like permease